MVNRKSLSDQVVNREWSGVNREWSRDERVNREWSTLMMQHFSLIWQAFGRG